MKRKLTEKEIDRIVDHLIAEHREVALADLAASVDVAKEVFETAEPTPEMVFGVAEIVFDPDNDEETAKDDLSKAFGEAKRIFGNPPTPQMVFGTYASVFSYNGHDEDGDPDISDLKPKEIEAILEGGGDEE